MKVTRQTSNTVDAVQWTGTPESLKEIQALLAPASPYYDGDFEQAMQYRSLGVPVSQVTTLGDAHRLDHVSPTSWVVKDGDAMMVMRDEQFKRSYRAQASGEGVNVDVVGPSGPVPAGASFAGQPVVATHPRALADVTDPRD